MRGNRQHRHEKTENLLSNMNPSHHTLTTQSSQNASGIFML